jgi:hypothetical protein
MTSKAQTERYPLGNSPLYRLGRHIDLAKVLRLTPKRMTSIIVRRSALYRFSDEEIDGKQRSLAVPINEMRTLHERLKDLLGRIVLPPYLHCPRRGKSAAKNALVHLGAQVVVKLDVKQFYPSTTDEHVFQFFRRRLGMVEDVAGRLTKLCTINGKVAFGSPLSPILCALVHDDLFGRVATRCERDDDVLSLWVDDLTISGNNVSQSLVRDIRRLIASKGLKTHKSQRSTRRRGIVVTGTFIGKDGPAPANKSHLKMKEKLRALENETDSAMRLSLIRSLLGMVTHQMSIYPVGGESHTRLMRRRQWLWNAFRKAEQNIDEAEIAKCEEVYTSSPSASGILWE